MSWSRRGFLTLAPLTALTVAGCTGNQATNAAGAEGETLWYHDPAERPAAPRLTGKDLEDAELDTTDVAGQVLVVNFWASWCAPCRREGPELVKAAEETEDSGVSFMGINIRDEKDKAISLERQLKVPYPSFFDPSGQLALEFDDVPPNTIPATVIIDAESRITAVFRQELDSKTLIDAIDEAAQD